MAKRTPKPRPELDDIKAAVIACFNIASSDGTNSTDMINVHGTSNTYGKARAATIRIAGQIGYNNQAIAKSLSYRRAGTVSQLGSKAVTWEIGGHRDFAKRLSQVRGYLQRQGFNMRPITNEEYNKAAPK